MLPWRPGSSNCDQLPYHGHWSIPFITHMWVCWSILFRAMANKIIQLWAWCSYNVTCWSWFLQLKYSLSQWHRSHRGNGGWHPHEISAGMPSFSLYTPHHVVWPMRLMNKRYRHEFWKLNGKVQEWWCRDGLAANLISQYVFFSAITWWMSLLARVMNT